MKAGMMLQSADCNREAGSQKFASDGEKIICDQILPPQQILTINKNFATILEGRKMITHQRSVENLPSLSIVTTITKIEDLELIRIKKGGGWLSSEEMTFMDRGGQILSIVPRILFREISWIEDDNLKNVEVELERRVGCGAGTDHKCLHIRGSRSKIRNIRRGLFLGQDLITIPVAE